jgi:hypothetical protein
MVATQKIHVGMIRARKTVTVTAEDDQFTLVIDGETVGVVPRTTPIPARVNVKTAAPGATANRSSEIRGGRPVGRVLSPLFP